MGMQGGWFAPLISFYVRFHEKSNLHFFLYERHFSPSTTLRFLVSRRKWQAFVPSADRSTFQYLQVLQRLLFSSFIFPYSPILPGYLSPWIPQG